MIARPRIKLLTCKRNRYIIVIYAWRSWSKSASQVNKKVQRDITYIFIKLIKRNIYQKIIYFNIININIASFIFIISSRGSRTCAATAVRTILSVLRSHGNTKFVIHEQILSRLYVMRQLFIRKYQMDIYEPLS